MAKPTWENTITQSERKSATCPHKFFLRNGLGLVPDYAAEPLYKGIIFHKIMEELLEFGPHGAIVRHRERRGFHEGMEGPDFLRANADYVRKIFWDIDWLARAYVAFWSKHGQDWQWEVVECEKRYTYPVTESVHLGGIPDKLVRYNGQLWILDHKTHKGKASEWAENSYDVQGPTYCWIVGKSRGERVAGIIYDICNSVPIKTEPLKVIKSGKRLAKHKPPHMTLKMYMERIDAAGFKYTDQPWMIANCDALLDREKSGYWFDRIAVPFTDREIERARLEWSHLAPGLAAIKQKHKVDRERFAALTENEWDQADAISEVAIEYGWHYPRAQSICKSWNRMCEYRTFCERPEGGPEGLVFRPKRKEYEDL